MSKQIVITGMGAVTPIGVGVDAYWDNLVSGVCGIGEITKLDTADLPLHRAAEVKDFKPKEHLSTRLAMDLEPFMQYAYVSAQQAIDQSGLDTHSHRVGVVMGTALGGITLIGDTQAQYATDHRQAGPKFLTKAMGNIAAAQLAIQFGIKGPSMTVSTACSSGGDAITLAALLLRAGAADAVVVLAGEAAICPSLIQSLCKTGALSKTGESRPFDKDRNGFVMGEGGGALVLECAEHAQARGAAVLARLLGCANNTDAFNPVSPDPEGVGAAACMRLALADGGLAPEQVDYLNAHGTATAMGDTAETRAIHQVFGAHPVRVSSTKGSTGHMMGAGGITEVIACVKAVQTGLLPPNLGLEHRDEQCNLNLVTAADGQAPVQVAMSNAMGFGGQNSCIIVGRP
jgi:3-oxoacyl-[acyl-carrier-protein] synthase II